MLFCEELLGLVSPINIMRGNSLSMEWLVINFKYLPEDANDEIVQ